LALLVLFVHVTFLGLFVSLLASLATSTDAEAFVHDVVEFFFRDVEELASFLEELFALVLGYAELFTSVGPELAEGLLGELHALAGVEHELGDVVLVEGS